VWSALFQQKPTPEDGVYFTKSLFRYYSAAPSRRYRTVYQAWDFAITEQQTSDYTVGATILQDENDGLYVLDIKRFRSDDSIEIVDTMIDYYTQYDADLIGFEDGQIWKTMQAQWEKRCLERRVYPSWEVLKPLTDKKVRAMPLRGRMQLGKVYFPEAAEWLHECRQEMLTFPAGKHDDQVDALAWAVRLTLARAAPTLPKPSTSVRSWREKLGSYGIEGEASAMAA
jgi:predicted phage terminase large subunit-like protein